MLLPLVPEKMAQPGAPRLPESPLFRPRSTRCLQRSRRKCCAPSRGEPLLEAANAQSDDALTVQSTSMPSVPLLQDYPRSRRKPLHAIVPRLVRAYHSSLWLVRSLLPRSFGKRRSLPEATWLGLHTTTPAC